MSSRTDAQPEPNADPVERHGPPPRQRKKPRRPRVRLTHLEVRRGGTLRLRIAIADDALDALGDEFGAFIKKITHGTLPPAPAPPQQAEFVVSRAHSDDDPHYHENVREYLVGLFSSLCGTSLADALEIARAERERRAEGTN